MDTRNDSTNKIFDALEKHGKRFADANGYFSANTVCAGLNKIRSSSAYAKGVAIATFNATHSSLACPATSGYFTKDPDFARYLHLGTTRIWNPDGSINESNWNKFINFIKKNQHADASILLQSTLKAYLIQCANNDPQDMNSGRNANSLFSSKSIQVYAASAAWDEVFDRLTCGWKEIENKPSEFEPYINICLVREFFVDSDNAFKQAEDQKLPIPKPASKQLNPNF